MLDGTEGNGTDTTLQFEKENIRKKRKQKRTKRRAIRNECMSDSSSPRWFNLEENVA